MLTTPTHNRIHPALTGSATEVFAFNGELYFLHNGRRGEWSEMPAELLGIFRQRLAEDSMALHHLLSWQKQEPIDILKQYVTCNFGGYDQVPDIDEEGNVQLCEYTPCSYRGHCPYEGKVCHALRVANGVLTRMELQVLQLVHQPTKHIAGRLHISTDTVNTHLKNLSRKTGYTRPGLVQLAILKGVNS